MDPIRKSAKHYASSEINLKSPDIILFASQVSLVFLVVTASLLNLTMEWGNQNLWTVVLTASLGYVMPSPKLKLDKNGKKDISNDLSL